jgi:hypothetical protein
VSARKGRESGETFDSHEIVEVERESFDVLEAAEEIEFAAERLSIVPVDVQPDLRRWPRRPG